MAADRGLSIRADREALPRVILLDIKDCELESELDLELLLFLQHSRFDMDCVTNLDVTTQHRDHDLNVIPDNSKPRGRPQLDDLAAEF